METRDTQRLAIRTAVILGQKPPQFVDQQALWNVTLTSAVFRHNIVVKVEESNNTIYPNVSADVTATGIDLNYTLSHQQSGTWELVWYLSEDDRNLTNLTLRFKAVSSVTNMTSYYTPDIVLCACVREEECDYLVSSLALSASNGSGMFYVAGCQCGLDKGGRFCQDDVSVCDVCYDNSTCDADLTQGNVCTKCPDGFLGDGVKCYEVDECRQTSPCNQQCANTVGSFNCSCHVGFTLVNATSCQGRSKVTGGDQRGRGGDVRGGGSCHRW
ncbi:mucin-like protein, partial [Littorina saxatilis]|uniref:mucin-like protein n=1 Tax=Littorina saxatilis TaxID=31220 RepID=UPI0038B61EC7